MRPTVGQSLHYRHDRHAEPWAALVTKVWADDLVNVALWDGNGCPVSNPPTSIRFVAPGKGPPSTGAWCALPPAAESEVAAAARRGFTS